MFFGRRSKKSPRSRSTSREKPSPSRELSPTMNRRHSLSRGRDEETPFARGYETPPRIRNPPRSMPRKVDHRSSLSMSLRRSLLKFRTSRSRSRWVTTICSVFVFGILVGLFESEPDLHIMSYDGSSSTNATPAKSVPAESVTDPVEQRRPALSEVNPLSDLEKKPVMVEVPRVGEDGSDLSHVRSLNLRAESMPQIVEDWSSGDRKYVRPYKDRSRIREGCELMGDWQETQHPTCNKMHEISMKQFMVESHILVSQNEQTRLVNNGAYRDVWMFRDFDGKQQALKTLRYNKRRDFDPRNYERHRRDAVAVDQLSGSPYIADIYGFCGMSALADYSTGGDLYAFIERNPPEIERLKVAHIVAASIADAHHMDSQGRATIAHTDIKPNQWIIIDGEYKLNDFNRARLLTWDPERNKHCGFTVEKNAGMWRSPEEYNYKPETHKVDIYSMGNVLYYLMAGQMPFDEEQSKMANDLVMRGMRPKIDDEIRNSADPYHAAMVEAMEMCWEHQAKRRTDARAVADLLQLALKAATGEGDGDEAGPQDDEAESQNEEAESQDDEAGSQDANGTEDD